MADKTMENRRDKAPDMRRNTGTAADMDMNRDDMPNGKQKQDQKTMVHPKGTPSK